MRAVLHTGYAQPWARALGELPWALLPAGNRPLLEYWLELCVNLGISEARLVLGDGAEAVEAYAGNGARWGLEITYSFQRANRPPDAFLRRDPERWAQGLLYLRGAAFPTQAGAPHPAAPRPAGTFLHRGADATPLCLVSDDPAFLARLIQGAEDPAGDPPRPWNALGIEPLELRSVADYYGLNMRLAGGDITRYVTPGYCVSQGSYIGYNVVIPPSVSLQPPLLVGNDCRFGALSVIGPRAVIGHHVVVDERTALADCIVLDDTYIGRGIEIRGRIVSGPRMIAPEDGSRLESDDPWLLASASALFTFRDVLRAAGGWTLALALVMLQAVPFLLLRVRNRMRGAAARRQAVRGCRGQVFELADAGDCHGRAPQILCLDFFPRWLAVLRGQLWLCGDRPRRAAEEDAEDDRTQPYFPAAVCPADTRGEAPIPAAEAADQLLYARHRSLGGDLRMVWRLFRGRLRRELARRPETAGS